MSPVPFVPEQRRRNDHLGMVAPAEDFQVGAASQRRPDANQHIVGADSGNANGFHPNVFTAVQYCGQHLLVHALNL